MTPHELEALASLLYGRNWMAPAARLLDVSMRTVQFWMAREGSARKAIPAGVLAELFAAIRDTSQEERSRMIMEAERRGEALEAVNAALEG